MLLSKVRITCFKSREAPKWVTDRQGNQMIKSGSYKKTTMHNHLSLDFVYLFISCFTRRRTISGHKMCVGRVAVRFSSPLATEELRWRTLEQLWDHFDNLRIVRLSRPLAAGTELDSLTRWGSQVQHGCRCLNWSNNLGERWGSWIYTNMQLQP